MAKQRQLLIGFWGEGDTDKRFLGAVIQRTFEEIAFECSGELDILPVQWIETPNGDFTSMVLAAAYRAEEWGLLVLCVHTDADATTDDQARQYKIDPAFQAVANSTAGCKELVAVIPVQMTEAWMLADKELLKQELVTNKNDVELGFHRPPENIANPKESIKQAIQTALANVSKRRRRLDISELYLPLGQKISLEKLMTLPSYRKFQAGVRTALQHLNYVLMI